MRLSGARHTRGYNIITRFAAVSSPTRRRRDLHALTFYYNGSLDILPFDLYCLQILHIMCIWTYTFLTIFPLTSSRSALCATDTAVTRVSFFIIIIIYFPSERLSRAPSPISQKTTAFAFAFVSRIPVRTCDLVPENSSKINNHIIIRVSSPRSRATP